MVRRSGRSLRAPRLIVILLMRVLALPRPDAGRGSRGRHAPPSQIDEIELSHTEHWSERTVGEALSEISLNGR